MARDSRPGRLGCNRRWNAERQGYSVRLGRFAPKDRPPSARRKARWGSTNNAFTHASLLARGSLESRRNSRRQCALRFQARPLGFAPTLISGLRVGFGRRSARGERLESRSVAWKRRLDSKRVLLCECRMPPCRLPRFGLRPPPARVPGWSVCWWRAQAGWSVFSERRAARRRPGSGGRPCAAGARSSAKREAAATPIGCLAVRRAAAPLLRKAALELEAETARRHASGISQQEGDYRHTSPPSKKHARSGGAAARETHVTERPPR